jgi:hypothetical protein
MASVIDALDDRMIEWIAAQPVYFVASAPSDGGHVNLSPKGHDTLRVLGPRSVAYLDLTGSGAETIAHTRQDGRLTIMLCAFEGPPRILRLFGVGVAHPVGTPRYDELAPLFPDLPGARSIVELDADRIQSSCGYAVPFMTFDRERPTLRQWAERKSPDELADYWADRNATSIDGLPALDPG